MVNFDFEQIGIFEFETFLKQINITEEDTQTIELALKESQQPITAINWKN